MKVIERGQSEGDAIHLSWDAAQAALASGGAVGAPLTGERDVDLPGAQQPAPGTQPYGGEEKAADGQILTNMTRVATPDIVSEGLPKSSDPPKPTAAAMAVEHTPAA